MPEQIINGSFVGELFVPPPNWQWINHCEGWGTGCHVFPFEEGMPENRENCCLQQNLETGCFCSLNQSVDLTDVSTLNFYGYFNGYHEWYPETPWATIWIDDTCIFTASHDDIVDGSWVWPAYSVNVGSWSGVHVLSFRCPEGNEVGLNHVSALSEPLETRVFPLWQIVIGTL